ncbi:MAG TPA: 2-hydroxyacid dehydrogenase [Candidatus Limnocylindrales bacterium]|nr:2-hydroxyacid dehydrogenase [Candidatus Limnocylindrales bacterium]
MIERLQERKDRVVVCLPDLPGREGMGALPPNVDVVLIPTDARPVPDLTRADMVVPVDRARGPLVEALADGRGPRVVQTLSAGFEWLVGRVPEGVIVCNAKGVFDRPVAEWVVAAILAMQRGLVRARDAQTRGTWEDFDPQELAGRRVLILGFGSIGSAVADRLRPFEVDITGIARTRRDGALGFEDLDAVLPAADILVDLLPVTSETDGMLDARRLALLPDGALVVNAGRGRTIVTQALVAELERGRLRAALDVTDPEPPPEGHALWSLPNVLLTPHIAGNSAEASERLFGLVGDQVRRFAAGQPLRNQVPRYLLE